MNHEKSEISTHSWERKYGKKTFHQEDIERNEKYKKKNYPGKNLLSSFENWKILGKEVEPKKKLYGSFVWIIFLRIFGPVRRPIYLCLLFFAFERKAREFVIFLAVFSGILVYKGQVLHLATRPRCPFHKKKLWEQNVKAKDKNEENKNGSILVNLNFSIFNVYSIFGGT
jgi:hypothetical protein